MHMRFSNLNSIETNSTRSVRTVVSGIILASVLALTGGCGGSGSSSSAAARATGAAPTTTTQSLSLTLPVTTPEAAAEPSFHAATVELREPRDADPADPTASAFEPIHQEHITPELAVLDTRHL